MMRITAYADAAAGRPGRRWTGPSRSSCSSATGSAAPRARVVGFPSDRRRRSRSSRPGPTRCSARRSWWWRPSTRWSTCWRPARGPTACPSTWTGGAATPRDAVEAYRRATELRTDLERQTEGRDKTGVFTGGYATNPVTGEARPGLRRRLRADGLRHRRDHGRARPGRAGLGVRDAVRPADRADRRSRRRAGRARPSPARARPSTPPTTTVSLDGLGVADAKARIIDWLEERDFGRRTVTYKLRDWLFSRQRYWGEPFPIVYDEDGLPGRAARLDAAGGAAGGRRLLAAEVRRGRRHQRAGAAAGPQGRTGSTSRWTWATGRSSTAARPTPCRSGPGRAGTSCATWTRPTPSASSTPRSSATGWARPSTAAPAASTCTSAARSTPCCTCCTRGSGTRCCTTWVTCRAPSRSTGCSTRATSRPTPTPTSAAPTSRPTRSPTSTATGPSSGRASRSTVSTGRWARA